MKKIISVVLCFVLAVSLGASCFADAIAVYPDQFYEEHVREFERTSLHCICASGSTAQKNPKSPIPAFDLKDNFSYAVFDKYTDDNGVVWAHIIEDNNPYYDAKHGWIPMTSLRRVYGGNEFYNDHSDEYIYHENKILISTYNSLGPGDYEIELTNNQLKLSRKEENEIVSYYFEEAKG